VATFHSSKGFHFSEDGSAPWAHFQRPKLADGEPFVFETDDPDVIERLAGIPGITRVDTPT
jgi:hypothetical protein